MGKTRKGAYCTIIKMLQSNIIKNAKQEEIAVDNCKLLNTFVMKDYYNNYRSTAKVIRRTITENTIIFTV